MLATLDPSRPIWDSNVLACLKFSLTGTTKDEKLSNAIQLYSSLEQWYDHFLQTEDANHCLTVFDHTIPEYAWLHPVKKIDFFLWSSNAV